MVEFKDFLESDLNNTFFNEKEFASGMLIDGESVSVVIDDYSLQKYNLKAEGEGLAKGELFFHAPISAFVEKPFVEKRIKIDKKLYKILDITEDLGVYSITLEGYRS